MTASTSRTFISQAVIVTAICVGAWSMLVKPQTDEIAKLEATLAQNAERPKGLGLQTVHDVANRMSDLRARMTDVEQRNELAGDTSKLYGLLTSLAERNGVHVQNLQPGAVRTGTGKDALSVSRIELTVDGPYENVAWFIDGINDLRLFIRPESLQLSPFLLMGRQVVTARLGFDILRFDLSAALTGLGDTAHAQQ